MLSLKSPPSPCQRQDVKLAPVYITLGNTSSGYTLVCAEFHPVSQNLVLLFHLQGFIDSLFILRSLAIDFGQSLFKDKRS